MSKPHILFVGESVTLAHVGRPLFLAESLDPEKYQISFASGSVYKDIVERYPFDLFELPVISQKVFFSRVKNVRPLYHADELEEYVEAEMALMEKIKPDLVVSDFRHSIGISAEIMKIPAVALLNAHWSSFSLQEYPVPDHILTKLIGVGISKALSPILSPLFSRSHIRPFQKIRKKYGLHKLSDIKQVYSSGDYVLYLDIPSFGEMRPEMPKNHRFIGPAAWAPVSRAPSWWESLDRSRPVVYVTMGSSGDIRILPVIVSALETSGFAGIVATAKRLELTPGSKNIFFETYLPGDVIMEKADLVICNGGSGTVYQALSKEVPVIGIPSNIDQFFTMDSVERIGVGITLRPERISREKIIRAIRMVLDGGNFREPLARACEEIGRYNAKENFPGFIAELMSNMENKK